MKIHFLSSSRNRRYLPPRTYSKILPEDGLSQNEKKDETIGTKCKAKKAIRINPEEHQTTVPGELHGTWNTTRKTGMYKPWTVTLMPF